MIGVGLGLTGRSVLGGSAPAPSFDPLAKFESGTYVGFLYNPREAANLFQLSNGTTAVTNGDPVGYDTDLTGNGNHAIQSVSGSRPTFPGLDYDGADDLLWILQKVAGGHDFVNFGDADNPISFICRTDAANASVSVSGTLAANIGTCVAQLRRRQGGGYKSPFTFGFNANKVYLGVAIDGGAVNVDKNVVSSASIANNTDTTIGFTTSFALVGGIAEISYSLYIGGVLDSSGTISLSSANTPNVGVSQADFTLAARTNASGVPSNFLQGNLGPAVIINRTLTADDFANYHTWMMS